MLDVVQTKKRYERFVEYLDGDDIRSFSIILPKMSGYVSAFNGPKLMSFL